MAIVANWQLSSAETLVLASIQAEIDLKEDALSKGVASTDTNGAVAVAGMTTNDGVLVTAQASAEAFYVTVGTGEFVVKASSGDAPIASLSVAWCKV